MIAPSVFSQAHKIKKSAQASLALPPAENMVNRWDFKEYEASGISKDQEQMNKSEEMEKQFNIIKSAESEVDFNNAMDYVQECLQLQSTINQSLCKSLESLLGSSMTMSSNLLLNRMDNYLKHCSKDVTEDDNLECFIHSQ